MSKFDYINWVTKNKHTLPLETYLTEITTDIFIEMSLPKGLLKENLSTNLKTQISETIQDKINKLPSNVKGEIKQFKDFVNNQGINFKDLLKSLATTFKGVPKEELPALLDAISGKGKVTFKEATKEVTSIEDLSNLSPQDTFTWNQETIKLPGDFLYSVTGNRDNSQSLIQGETYTLAGGRRNIEVDPADIISPSPETDRKMSLINTGWEASPRGQKAKEATTFMKKIANSPKSVAVGAMLMLGVMLPQMFGNTSAEIVDSQGGQENVEQVIQQNTDIDTSSTLDLSDQFTGGLEGEGDLNKLADIVKGIEPDSETHSTDFKVQPTGEYGISDADAQEMAEGLFDITKEKIETQIKDNSANKGVIKVVYEGHVSNNGNDNSNLANDGTDLQGKREADGAKVANIVVKLLNDYIQQNYPDADINVELGKIDNSNYESQKVQPGGGVDQGFSVASDLQLESDEAEKPLTSPDSPDQVRKFEPPQIPFKTPTLEKFTAAGNRNTQWAIVMAEINPDYSIFPYLNKDGSNEVKGPYGESMWTRNNDNYLPGASKMGGIPEEIHKLAKGILSARKNPSKVLDIIGDIIGVKFPKRQKTMATQPGSAGQSSFTAGGGVQETTLHPFNDLLREADYDNLKDFFDESIMNSKKAKIIAMLGSMYARETGKREDKIVNLMPDDLDDKTLNQLKDFGFSQITTGLDKGTYIFLDKKGGDTTQGNAVNPGNLSNQDNKNLQRTISSNSKLLNDFRKINTRQELEDLLVVMVSYVDDKLKNNKSQLRNVMVKLSNDKMLKEQQLKLDFDKDINTQDTKNLNKTLVQNQTLKDRMSKIDNLKELEEFISTIVIANTLLFQEMNKKPENKQAIKTALTRAASRIMSDKSQSKLSKSISTIDQDTIDTAKSLANINKKFKYKGLNLNLKESQLRKLIIQSIKEVKNEM